MKAGNDNIHNERQKKNLSPGEIYGGIIYGTLFSNKQEEIQMDTLLCSFELFLCVLFSHSLLFDDIWRYDEKFFVIHLTY